MEIAGLKLWQAGTVLGIAAASSFQAPSVGYAVGAFLGVATVFWMFAFNLRKGMSADVADAA